MLISYSDVFGNANLFDNIGEDEINNQIIELLADIPTFTIIEILSYISSCIHFLYRDEFEPIQKELQNKLFSCLSIAEQKEIAKNLLSLQSNPEDPPFIFTHEACLYLMQKALLRDSITISEMATKEQNLEARAKLFKAYLLVNEITGKRQVESFVRNGNKMLPILEGYKAVYIPTFLPHAALDNNSDVIVQIYKAIRFFRFIEQDTRFASYLPIFLESVKCPSWQVYIQRIMTLYTITTITSKTHYIAINREEFPTDAAFFDCLSINLETFQQQTCSKEQIEDFKLLREKPLYKTHEGYFILSKSFLADTIFNALFFNFNDLIGANFKGIYSHDFSEKIIFYDIIKNCFPPENQDIIKLYEEECNKLTDFYVRKGNNIFLFEHKDYTLAAKVKHSYDSKKTQDYLYDRFKKTINNKGKGHGTGAFQLATAVERLIIENLNFDPLLDNIKKEITVFPIIVFTDPSFKLDSINHTVNGFFHEKISEMKSNNIELPFELEDLVMIDLDLLLLFQDAFRSERLNLTDEIRAYNKFLKQHSTSSNMNFDKAILSFSSFLRNSASEKGIIPQAPTDVLAFLKEK